MQNTATFFVTGATGFIGKNLIEKLARDGLLVRCLVRRREDKDLWKYPGVTTFLGDILDKKSLQCATLQTDICIHLASLINSNDTAMFERVNVEGMSNIVKACVDNRIKKFIYVSSIDAETNPSSLYGRTKLAAEEILKNSPLCYTILRPTVVYGRGDHKHIASLIDFIKRSPIVPMIGNGEYKRQPVYAGDLISVIKKCAQTGRTDRKIYNIAGPYALSMNEIVRSISAILGKKRIIVHLPLTIVKRLCLFLGNWSSFIRDHTQQILSIDKDKVADIGQASEELGFKPLDFNQALKIMLGKVC
ncbi:MAG: NAD-dependent epimerase/dehydratase family protein [Candidatus Omnitrophica bacterium]|nr:NAD-dependent epimerase/dehydratase family protein [Candidatus Omnitrophota bacterium]